MLLNASERFGCSKYVDPSPGLTGPAGRYHKAVSLVAGAGRPKRQHYKTVVDKNFKVDETFKKVGLKSRQDSCVILKILYK